MRRLVVCVLALFVSLAALGQQEYVGRYDAFSGFSYLASPKLNLEERGWNGELGVNVTRWLALGGDFSVFTGHTSLHATDLNATQQAKLAPFLPLLPPGFVISVPFDSTTYTFSAGPQINIRKLSAVTFFVRPALGAMHEKVTLKPDNPITMQLVGALVPSTKQSDTEVFYGFGGGFDLNATRHVAIRLASDFVHVNLFTNLLNGGRNSVRFSVGPAFRWGKNVE